MNEQYHNEIDQLLDDIIFSKLEEEKLNEFMRGKPREEVLNELIMHQTAASAVQRFSVISQVAGVHNAFMQHRLATGSRKKVVYMKPRRFNVLGIAAAALVVIAGLLFLYATVGTTPEKLYAQEYQPYHFNVDRAESTAAPQQVTHDYQNANYESAISAFNSKKATGVNEQMAAAFSYMQLKQYQPASEIFEQVITVNAQKGTRIYQDEAEYYLALSLLRLNQVERSYQLFDKIYNDTEHTYNGRINKWFMIRLRWLK